jgi:zinc protease
MTLVMMGDMTPDEMRDLADAHFGGWTNDTSPPPIAEPEPVTPLKAREAKAFTETDYTECTINLGFTPANGIDPDEEETVAVLNSILASSALTSRMGVELRDKQGLIYGIKSELWSPRDRIGYWKFNTKTAPKNVEKVLAGIFGETRKLLSGGVTAEELARAKSRQLGLLPLLVETPDDIASRVFELLNDRLPFDHFDRKADRINAVTADDVLRVARRYLTPDRYVLVVDGPIDQVTLDRICEKL